MGKQFVDDSVSCDLAEVSLFDPFPFDSANFRQVNYSHSLYSNWYFK